MDVLNVLKNVIAIIGIIAAGAFVIVFLADLLISIIDGKNGIFFKRGNVEQNQQPVQQEQQKRERVLELEEKNEKEEVKLIAEPQQSSEEETTFGKVDFEKADEEERLLRERLQLNVVADEEEVESPVMSNSEEEALKAKIRELEEKNKELTDALLNTTAPEEEEEVVAPVEQDEEDSDDMIDYFNEYKDIIDAITADATQQAEEEEASDIDNLPSIEEILSQPVETEKAAEEEVAEEQLVSVEDVLAAPAEEVAEEPVEEVAEEVAEPVEELKEEDNALLAEIEELRRQLEEEKAKMEEVRQEAMYKTAMLEGEKERLAEELKIANEQKEAAEAANKEREAAPALMSKEEYQTRLDMLKDRLKANEKQLRVCKKEYKPLERVNKTLNSDKQKLRRKEAIVAKQKVLLYGVNNYVDIDEEKAKKLAEDLDLLDGLRLSVQHCEEVMNANRDRFPILEQTYKILTETNKQILADIKECEEGLEAIRKAEEENGSNE